MSSFQLRRSARLASRKPGTIRRRTLKLVERYIDSLHAKVDGSAASVIRELMKIVMAVLATSPQNTGLNEARRCFQWALLGAEVFENSPLMGARVSLGLGEAICKKLDIGYSLLIDNIE